MEGHIFRLKELSLSEKNMKAREKQTNMTLFVCLVSLLLLAWSRVIIVVVVVVVVVVID